MFNRILSNLPRWLAPALISLGLVACGGGGGTMTGSTTGPQGCTSSTCGNAMMTLTDAAGDFASYTVDVTSLKLTKADGTVVETLPVKTRVDFTQLVDVTELVSSAAIPMGEYVSATLSLDYSNASIFVYSDANDTQSVQAAQILDASNNVLWSATPPSPSPSPVSLTVQLDPQHHLFVNPGKLSRLALDFNVAASNTVNLANPAAPVITVQPFIVASVVPTDTKQIRVRGSLVSVDVAAGSYVVQVQPFDDENTDRGQVTVNTTATTRFEVDGNMLDQADGLNALMADGAGTKTVAFGTLSTTDGTFTAASVLGGTSVENPALDRLKGVVISRSTVNGVITLVVRGGRAWRHDDDSDDFVPRNVDVTIGDATKYVAASITGAMPDSSWPSVGSRITAFGKYTPGTGSGATAVPASFDATAGRVRLEITSLWGIPSSAAGAQVTLNLQAIEGYPVATFDFTGTGSNPAAYIVNTGTLPAVQTPVDGSTEALRFFGLVQPFGKAPPDFNAITIVNFTNTSALLTASFGDGSMAALTASTTNLVLNVSDPLLGWMHFIRIGPLLIDLKTLASNVTITPDTTATFSWFAIRTEAAAVVGDEDSIDMFNNYADFEAELATKLAGGAKVLRVEATGHYDQGTNTLASSQIAIDLR